jgi:ArsR family transcriptional regulator
VRARDAAAREFFERGEGRDATALPAELPAYLSAIAPLVTPRRLAIDVGTGDGSFLDVLAPIYEQVIAIDRAEAQLARAAARLEVRGYQNVELRRADYDDPELAADVALQGGADAVFASRVLHHAPRPAAALAALGRLARPGGAVVVIDYRAHEDERLRDQQADEWLGFDPGELASLAKAAGLLGPTLTEVPSRRCGNGPDGHLDWQVLCARKTGE